MDSFSHYVSQNIPWVWPVLAWTLIVVALLALLASPAYFIVFPIARRLREALTSYLTQLFARHTEDRESRRKAFDALVDDFRRNSGITYLSEGTARLEGRLASFSALVKQLNARLNRFVDFPKRFERIAARIGDAASKAAPVFPEVPSAEQLSAQHGRLRTAQVRLFVSTLLLLSLISVNTGMLGQILRDLGIITSK